MADRLNNVFDYIKGNSFARQLTQYAARTASEKLGFSNPKYLLPTRQLVKMSVPSTWDPHRIERFSQRVLPLTSWVLRAPELIKSYTNSVEDYKTTLKSIGENRLFKEVIANELELFNREQGQSDVENNPFANAKVGGNLTLASSKTVFADERMFQQTPAQATQTVVLADLFSYQPRNEGLEGALAVDQARNYYDIRLRSPLTNPRSPDFHFLLNTPSEAWQWNHELPLESIQLERVEELLFREFLKQLLPVQTQHFNLNDVDSEVGSKQLDQVVRPIEQQSSFIPACFTEELTLERAGPLPLSYNNRAMIDSRDNNGYGHSEFLSKNRMVATDTKPDSYQRFLQQGFYPLY